MLSRSDLLLAGGVAALTAGFTLVFGWPGLAFTVGTALLVVYLLAELT